MKLLFIQETDWLKRFPAQQHHLAEMMTLRGHEVLVIDYALTWRTDDKKGLFSERQVLENVSKIHPEAHIAVVRPSFLKIPILDYISMMFSHRKEIKKQLKDFKPDAVVGFGILNSATAVRLLKNSKIPFVFYWLDALHLLIPTRIFRSLGRILESYALKRCDMAIAINERLKELMIRLGAPASKTSILRAGISLEKFNPDIDAGNIRKQYGISPKDRALFFMGFLYHFSGLKEVARKLAVENNNGIKLLIVGEGDALEELRTIQEKYKLQDYLILVGRKPYDEIPGLIAASDICLLPAYTDEPIMQDIVPIKLYEYLAMKKPVIASRLPGVVTEFGEGNGIVYIEKPEEVIEKAKELLENDNLEHLKEKAREFAERNSWERITQEFEETLGELIYEKAGKLS